MEFISVQCSEEQAADGVLVVSPGTVKKYTYVLPSGRRLKVVVDDESEYVQTACAAPCFVLRMEDDPEA